MPFCLVLGLLRDNSSPSQWQGLSRGPRCLLRPLFSSQLDSHRKTKHVGATGLFSFAWFCWVSWAPAIPDQTKDAPGALHYSAYQRTPPPDAAPTLEPRLLSASGRGHFGAARGEALAVEIWGSVRTSELDKGLGRPDTFTRS